MTKRKPRSGGATPAARVLAWYGENARDLPWRTPPGARASGVRPDPFHVLLSEVMLQQTTVRAVGPRYRRFLERWPSIEALAAAPVEDVMSEWSGLGYYARARNLHRCARAIARDFAGVIPDTEEALRALPGVGPYTAAAVAAIAFGRRALAIDANVERVIARLFAIEESLPKGRAVIRAHAEGVWPQKRSGEFAEGLMDLGAAVCTPRAPRCPVCPLAAMCAAARTGRPEAYPRRALKAARPIRRGAALVLFDRRGRVFLERRPDKGLLGGALGLPGTPWREEAPDVGAWSRIAAPVGRITHVFTHFRLDLDIHAGASPAAAPRAGEWFDAGTVRLPTVMRKALDLALAARTRR